MARHVELIAVFAVAACQHWHSDRNAPGHIDVLAPPLDVARRTVESPTDPGEHVVMFSPGFFGGGGGSFGNGRVSRTFGLLGIEAGFRRGVRNTSHTEGDWTPFFPDHAWGANLGWTFANTSEGGLHAGPIYVELQYSLWMSSFAAGYAIDPNGDQGPQLTLSAGPFYFRTTYFVPDAAAIQFGLVVKFPFVWAWNR
jgi:hypothetical protein